MKNEFQSLGEFATHLLMLQAAVVVELNRGLDHVAKAIEDTAKSEIGEYQPAVGPFQDWAPLAESTEAEKARLGYPADAPLLREGDLRNSIERDVQGLEAVVGSKSDIAVYQEFGTAKIPPRPVIGPAAFRNGKKIQKILGAATVSGLLGGGVRIHRLLGYDMDIKD